MKNIFLFTLFSFFHFGSFAQKALSIQGSKINEKRIYFLVEDKKIKYFTIKEGQDDKESTGDSKTFALKNNFSNLYFKWLPPIKYRYNWKDTTYNDERDQAIKEFIDKLVGQFGASVSGLNTNKSESKNAISKSGPPAPPPAGATTLYIPTDGFNSVELTLLFLQLRSNQNLLTVAELTTLNAISKELEELDKKNATNISKSVDDVFTSLYDIEDPTEVKGAVSLAESEEKKYQSLFTQIEELQKAISKAISDFTITDKLLNTYTKVIIPKFIEQTITILNSNKTLVSKLKPIFVLMKNSIKDESQDLKGFFRLRDISFEDGRIFETTVGISEFEYKSDSKEFKQKGEIAKSKFVFKKYDFFAISVSSGIFYSNTTLKGFGVSNNNNQFNITEDDIKKSSPVTAVFLNFNFGVSSRYFSPLFQIGIDPTKKRPFLLFGGGFSIPSARIAFSGGPIWTWNQSLNKLSVGQTISSTTDLEKDLQYKFEIEPKGWYLGIQYNF